MWLKACREPEGRSFKEKGQAAYYPVLECVWKDFYSMLGGKMQYQGQLLHFFMKSSIYLSRRNTSF